MLKLAILIYLATGYIKPNFPMASLKKKAIILASFAVWQKHKNP